jgi:hypothetical protein
MLLKSKLSFLIFFVFNCIYLAAATPGQIEAIRIESAPKIDGLSEDPEWKKVPLAFSGHFTQRTPDNLEPSAYKTEIKIAYNDFAFYVLVKMLDPEPGSIPRELGLRDDWGRNTDRLAFMLDTYNKGQNAFYFGVTAAGVQLDSYIVPQYSDRAWDAVWKSEVSFNEEGWVAEFEIPYSAIRFPKTAVQRWGINFMRTVQRDNEESTWNPVDNSISGFVNQAGLLQGIEDVKPPLRLQFFPYVSSVIGHNGENGHFRSTVGGGMDVKYGINESFTLDMSLVPDFSQVQSDNLVLNLSPFEVRFDENRPFFTEGTDLFNKGGLFYSRRVGQIANTFDARGQVKDQEEIVSNPGDTQLLNAAKISGRTQKGLGIGFFNAVTDNTYLEVQDQESGQTRQVLIDPITNFNVMVLDQNLKNNSSISLLNTNVTRWQGGRDANVTATDFRLHDKSNTYRLEGFGAYNHIQPSHTAAEPDLIQGYKYLLRFRKVSGKIQYGIHRNVESDTYDINDMGFIRAANEVSHSVYGSYNVFKPFWIFNRLSYNLSLGYSQLYAPRAFSSFDINNRFNAQLKSFWSFGGWYGMRPVDSYDFFEPRTEGYYFTRKSSFDIGLWMRSDSRKRLAVYSNAGMFRRPAWESRDQWFTLAPRYRISDRFSMSHNLNISRRTNERGYVRSLDDEQTIVFGNREVRNMENVSSFNFIFNNKMGLSLRVRHYWSQVAYDRFFELKADGNLSDIAYSGLDEQGQKQHDKNFNAFNLDMVYQWQVAPGSFLTFAWKDAIYDQHTNAQVNFGENIRELSRRPQHNSISLKLTYFVDYLMFKKLVPWQEPAAPAPDIFVKNG